MHLLADLITFFPFAPFHLCSSSPSKEALAVNLDLSGWPDKKWRLGIWQKSLFCDGMGWDGWGEVKSRKCRSGSTPICLWSVSQPPPSPHSNGAICRWTASTPPKGSGLEGVSSISSSDKAPTIGIGQTVVFKCAHFILASTPKMYWCIKTIQPKIKQSAVKIKPQRATAPDLKSQWLHFPYLPDQYQ